MSIGNDRASLPLFFDHRPTWRNGVWSTTTCVISSLVGAIIFVIIARVKPLPTDHHVQTAVPTDYVLYGINLKNGYSLNRERSSYNLFAMLLKTLLNELVCTVHVATSRTNQTVSVSIDFYVEIRFDPGGLFSRYRFQFSDIDSFRCPVASSDSLIHDRFEVECCSSAFPSRPKCPINYCRNLLKKRQPCLDGLLFRWR
jgi:hypothetical protein